jgi:small subunit ribosomal protein S6
MNNYEFAILYHPDLEVDLSKAEGKLTKIITDNGGKITKTDNWGKRKLAYTVKGHEHAVYVFYTVEVPAGSVQKIESTLNITDEVIRFLITRPDVKAMEKAEAVKAKRKGKEESEEKEKVETSEEE